ncbi:hypothetical protein H4S03_005801 [Coemansia sp. S3946]|nr:hypothetical protein H4S03_005801 [Coemansia sp. S3946]
MEFSKLPLLSSLGSLPAEPPPSLSSPAPTVTGIEGPVHNNVKTSDTMCPSAQVFPQMWVPEMPTSIPSLTARPIEPALLWGEQLLPPPMARDFVIGILCFMVGCVVTTVVIRYGQGTVSKSANDEAVNAAQSARSDQVTVAGGYVKIGDMAAAAVQQAPVDDDGTVNGSADEQPAGSAAEPGNPEPCKKTHRSKRGGVKVRARLERRMERQSNMPAEEPAPIDTRLNSPVAVGSNDSFSSRRRNDQRANQAIAPADSQSRGSTTEANNQGLSSANQRDQDDKRANLAQAQMDTPNRPAAAGPDNSSFSRPRDGQRANQAQTLRDRQPNRSVATEPRDWSSPRRRSGEQANEEPGEPGIYGQQFNGEQVLTTAFSSNGRRNIRIKNWR